MKISDEMRYPHPVLSESTGDYLEGHFDIEFEIAEHKDKATVALNYEVILEQEEIRRLIAADQAAVGIYVTCLDTYYSNLVRLSLSASNMEFEAGQLSGRVVIRPLVWSTSNIGNFVSDTIHEEFGGGPFAFLPASVLAVGSEVAITIGRDKLRELETIFALAKRDELEPGTFGLDLDADKITILIAPHIYELVNRLRGVPIGRAITLNSLYLPAVMEVLSALAADSEQYDAWRWHPIFLAKCQFLGIDIENSELWTDSQKLLGAPFQKIQMHAEKQEI